MRDRDDEGVAAGDRSALAQHRGRSNEASASFHVSAKQKRRAGVARFALERRKTKSFCGTFEAIPIAEFAHEKKKYV